MFLRLGREAQNQPVSRVEPGIAHTLQLLASSTKESSSHQGRELDAQESWRQSRRGSKRACRYLQPQSTIQHRWNWPPLTSW